MNGYEAYKLYISLKNHFNVPEYDFFKHHPKNVSEHSYERRKDQHAFVKLAKKPKPHSFILANLLVDPECFPVHLTTKTAEDTYKEWRKRIESLAYNFKQELLQLKPEFNSNIHLDKDQHHPYLLKALIRQVVSLETVTILVEMTKAASYWEQSLRGDILWEEFKLRLIKYPPFLSYDKSQMQAAVVAAFQKGD